ncbi:MAG: hypothetical protein LBM74_03405 [Oscillospiraceae bacterium]|jgi:hypothetical protein|nr:hypothetical protein [Oscillospiraceae bacterium]
MIKNLYHGHQQPVYILERVPRPSDRETRFIAPGGGWMTRAFERGERL